MESNLEHAARVQIGHEANPGDPGQRHAGAAAQEDGYSAT